MLGPAEANALERLERLMGEGFDKVNGRLDGLDNRLRVIENQEGRPCAIEAIKMAQRESEHNALKRDHELLRARVDSMEPWVRGMRWAVLALGGGLAAALLKLFLSGG